MQCLKQYYTRLGIVFLASLTLFLGFHSTAFADTTSYIVAGAGYVPSSVTEGTYMNLNGKQSYTPILSENFIPSYIAVDIQASSTISGTLQLQVANFYTMGMCDHVMTPSEIAELGSGSGVRYYQLYNYATNDPCTSSVSIGERVWANFGSYPYLVQSKGVSAGGENWNVFEVYGNGWAPEPPPPADTSTRVISLSPAQDVVIDTPTTTLSSSVYNQVERYNKYIVSLSYVEPSRNVDLLLSDAINQQFVFDLATSTSDQSFSTTTDPLLSGRWLVNAVFSNGTDGSNYFTATSSTFVVGTSTTFYSDFVYSTSTDYGKVSTDCQAIYASSTASLISKSVCWMGDRIGQTLEYLFVPSGFFIDKYIKLKDDMMDRVPFGYFTRTKELLNSVNASSTAAFEIPIPVSIKNFLFNKIRDMMNIALPVLWVVRMYIRLKDIKI